MKRMKSLAILGALCMCASLPVHAQKPTSGSRTAPDAVVAALYKQHKTSSPFFQTRSRALVNKYFDKPLADLIWKDATTSKEEVGALDGDPLYNAQDTEIRKFLIGKPVISEGTAKIKVTFTNFNKKEEILFELVLKTTGWKVANITYGDGNSLMGLLKQNLPGDK